MREMHVHARLEKLFQSERRDVHDKATPNDLCSWAISSYNVVHTIWLISDERSNATVAYDKNELMVRFRPPTDRPSSRLC